MTRIACSWTLALILATFTASSAARADIELIAQGAIPGDRTDLSGLTDRLSDGTPHNALGGMGSAIAYTGKGDVYVLLADRGPKDGSTPYRCRVQTMKIVVTGKKLEATLQATTLLSDEKGNNFIGFQGALGKAGAGPLRLDPEGIRWSPHATFYVSDEYGPYIYEFNGQGKRVASLPVPRRFQVPAPNADPKLELELNKTGRVPNRGMEGLAITPDGRKLIGIMQSPLIQDGGRKGTNVRLLEIDLSTRGTREFLYELAGAHTGVSEIVAVNDQEYLVLERDGAKSDKAPFRKIFKISLAKASDISALETLPMAGVPNGVVPASKTEFFDFLDPRFGLAGPDMPVKIEGLAFGPDLPDGRHLLLATSDNDFQPKQPVRLFGFAVGRSDLPGYVPQRFGN
jgi:hypothetical protein